MGFKLSTCLLFDTSVFGMSLCLPFAENKSRWATPIVHVLHPPISPSLRTTRPVFCIKCVSVGQRSPLHMQSAHVAWLNWTHTTPRSNKHIKLPSAPHPCQWICTKAWRRERGGEKGLRETQGASQILHKQTQVHKLSERKGGHISYSPANVSDMRVCVSGCVCHAWHSVHRYADSTFLEFVRGLLNLRSCIIIIRARDEAQHLRHRRYPGICGVISLSSAPVSNQTWASRETPVIFSLGELHVRWTHFHQFSFFFSILCSMEQVFHAKLFLDFLAFLVKTFAPV